MSYTVATTDGTTETDMTTMTDTHWAESTAGRRAAARNTLTPRRKVWRDLEALGVDPAASLPPRATVGDAKLLLARIQRRQR